MFAVFEGLGSLCSMGIVFMVLLLIVLHKLTPQQAQTKVTETGLTALFKALFGKR